MKDKEKQYISMKEMLTKRSFEPITNCNCVEETRYAVRKDAYNAGTMADLLNQEIEELQKALKEKQIEEIAKDILSAYAVNKLYSQDVAKSLYEQGYRKIEKDSVVIPNKITEETSAEDLIKIAKYNDKIRKQANKETAEKILNELYCTPKEQVENKIKDLARFIGVEIKE